MKWLQIDRRCFQGQILPILSNGGSSAGIWMDNCGKTPRCPVKRPSNPYLTSWFIFALSNWSLIYETMSPSCTVFVLTVQRSLMIVCDDHFKFECTLAWKTHILLWGAVLILFCHLFMPLWSLMRKTLVSEVEKKTASFKCKFAKGAGSNFLSFRKPQTKRRGGLSHTVDTMLIFACGPLLMHLSQTGCKMRNHL